ncbi:MAG: GNAT family N-acetyltransferase, partial [Gemmataceae bacterium]
RHLNDREVYRWTLRIPFPYSDYDADRWLELVATSTFKLRGRPAHWAIRAADGQLIGAAGFDGLDTPEPYRVEIGYWLARPFWGQGIASAVVARLCRHVFEDWRVGKVMAHVFEGNFASIRVLEKNGFQLEGNLRAHYRKDGRPIDVRLYGLLRS